MINICIVKYSLISYKFKSRAFHESKMKCTWVKVFRFETELCFEKKKCYNFYILNIANFLLLRCFLFWQSHKLSPMNVSYNCFLKNLIHLL